jgi:hypothetical protein
MSISQKTFSFLLCFFSIFVFFEGATVELHANAINLPKRVGHWVRPDSPRIIDAKNIFEYMNGAGELYLGYRFSHIEVFDYTSKSQENILVELYFMETSDDAFGLLSLDWGGEHVSFGRSNVNTSDQSFRPSARALYGGGLLRIWSDSLYARIMADRETSDSKQAVHTLGEAIAAKQKRPPEPELLKFLHSDIGSGWRLLKDRLSFFRTYLVLNSIYYISEENILDLDLSAEAVMVPYEHITGSSDQKRIQFLFVKYENNGRARKALSHFHDAYLPEHKKKHMADSDAKNPNLFKLEDGWLAYKRLGKYIVIVFESPDQESAREIIQKNGSNLLEKGGYHER